MARYSYESGWTWARAVMMVDPKYDSWLDPPEDQVREAEAEAQTKGVHDGTT
jgi:hypothetical protein